MVDSPYPLWLDILGSAATALTTFCMLPQVWQCWRTKDVAAISIGTYVLYSCATAAWVAYGYVLSSWPMMVGDGLCFLFTFSILCMKLRWQRQA